ncbi:MAG TPA: NUDIX domain-containing protein [Steroidobacteraceae bacterium]|jgi:8-oxo-dGTP pyrophosphatase MutT (NUDIX family)|nr:NUDIX domain-containing protein [Steroidobacteraceae bacterium]
MRFADKVCPVVFRDASMRQILAFEHPEAGVQLVKGGIEPGENARAAALRELHEEAGISQTAIAEDLGTWNSGEQDHIWSLHLCTFTPTLPESWTHRCEDDGGHEFKFFWHDVNATTDEKWPPQYRRALEAIRERTRALRWRG